MVRVSFALLKIQEEVYDLYEFQREDFSVVYFDDVLIGAKSNETLLERVEIVLSK